MSHFWVNLSLKVTHSAGCLRIIIWITRCFHQNKNKWLVFEIASYFQFMFTDSKKRTSLKYFQHQGCPGQEEPRCLRPGTGLRWMNRFWGDQSVSYRLRWVWPTTGAPAPGSYPTVLLNGTARFRFPVVSQTSSLSFSWPRLTRLDQNTTAGSYYDREAHVNTDTRLPVRTLQVQHVSKQTTCKLEIILESNPSF